MSRNEEPVTSKPGPSYGSSDSRIDTHPAFGVAIVTRSSGTPRTLFQSDLRHHETIHLRIETAERGRDLNRDWVHPSGSLIEIEMSLAQWGALVSSIGIGSGVPVTLRRTESEVQIPTIPYEPRIAENVAETKGAVSRLLARAQETLAALDDAITNKKGAVAVRDALRTHKASVENASGNAAFAVTSLAEAAEAVTSQAKADIESHILQASQITGTQASIEAPSFEQLES